ncbi:UNVERIFIED_CONTAM: Transcription factor bHLH25 [Sesamum indicum]
MDTSSVLEDAIKYLKHLQERVKKLEEQAKKKSVESAVFVRKSQIVAEDEGSSDEQSGSYDEQPLPEIETRICDNRILIKVHCENQKGVLVNLLYKVESLNMTIFNTIATPFGMALDVTIIAELEEEFNLTMKEVVTAIRSVLQPPSAAA